MAEKRGWRKYSSPNAPPLTELDHLAPAPGVGVITGAQARGAIAYGLIGLLAGLVLGTLVALVPIDDWTYWGRVALFGGVAAFGGLIAGAVFGGGYEPETEGDVDIVDLRDGRQMRRKSMIDPAVRGGSVPTSSVSPRTAPRTSPATPSPGPPAS